MNQKAAQNNPLLSGPRQRVGVTLCLVKYKEGLTVVPRRPAFTLLYADWLLAAINIIFITLING